MKKTIAILLMSYGCFAGNAFSAEPTKPAGNSIEPEMVRINPGSFMMGSDDPSDGYEYAGVTKVPKHRVSIAYSFEMGKTEVTQAQWIAVMGENPSGFSKCGDDCPVENIDWYDTKRFIKRLNKKTGKEYRLPSEAEWEYACRAGGEENWCGDNDVNKVAWYIANSGNETSSVASKKPNNWGLYDMSGNVWEWVQDCYSWDFNGTPVDGSAREVPGCNHYIVRGGSGGGKAEEGHSRTRGIDQYNAKSPWLGFRLARTLP